MNKMINIDSGYYFEIKDSEMFGGEGSIGYTATKIEAATSDEFTNEIIKEMSDIAGVSKENVRLISKEEYIKNTGESEDENE